MFYFGVIFICFLFSFWSFWGSVLLGFTELLGFERFIVLINLEIIAKWFFLSFIFWDPNYMYVRLILFWLLFTLLLIFSVLKNSLFFSLDNWIFSNSLIFYFLDLLNSFCEFFISDFAYLMSRKQKTWTVHRRENINDFLKSKKKCQLKFLLILGL